MIFAVRLILRGVGINMLYNHHRIDLSRMHEIKYKKYYCIILIEVLNVDMPLTFVDDTNMW